MHGKKVYHVRGLKSIGPNTTILHVYPRKTFYKPEFYILGKIDEKYDSTLPPATKQIWPGIWGVSSSQTLRKGEG